MLNKALAIWASQQGVWTMALFRAFLIAAFVAIFIYTIIVIFNHGMTLLPVFVGDLLALDWSGQFNLDFSIYLALSAVWIAWRSGFSTGGIAFALVAGVLGAVVFLPYVLWQLSLAKGDIRKLLLGTHADG